MRDHCLPKRFPPIDARAEPRVMGYALSARRHQFKATSLIGFAMVGVFSGSIVLAPPLQAWAEHDPQAIWGLVPESHGVRVTKPPRTKIKHVKEDQAAKKQSPGQLTRATSIPTSKKGAKVSPSVALAKETESPGITVAEAHAAEKDRLPAAPQTVHSHEATQVQVTMGTSVIVDVPGQLQRASVTNPEIANIQIVPPNQILVNGKAPGITTLIAWVDGGRQYFDIVVKSNLSLLEQAMKEISPQEEIVVRAVQTSVVLSGTVSNPSQIARAAHVAKAFLPDKAAVVNLLQLGEPHQIMLKVEVAEVNRKALRELGLDFIALGTTFTLALFGGTAAGVLNTTIDEMGKQLFGSRTSAIIGDPRTNTNAFLRALEQKGLVKSLARPNLIAASGASASFLVGGEFPIPVPGGGGFGTVTIEFKPFGVRLDFTPTLNDLGSINLKITPEVSDLDFENGLTSGGFRIPALRTRRASTIVDLRPGQSLAIGGLISSDDRKVMSKFPILGDIPLLGALFRSTNFVRNETDLIIFVTPEIVKPLEAAQAPNLEEQMKTTPEEAKEIRQIPGK
jgi:pilus assembly protein CpaC